MTTVATNSERRATWETMTKVTLFDAAGRVIAELSFPRGKAPRIKELFALYPAAERVQKV